MRRMEQRNKVKKLAERTKNNSEEGRRREAKRRERDWMDWARERGRNETDTSRGMEKGERRWSARLDTLEMASRKWRNVWKDGTEDWSHLVCTWYAKGCLRPELAYPSRQFSNLALDPHHRPDPLSSRDRGERRQMRLVPRRRATNWREPISDTPFPRHPRYQRCPRRATIFLVEKLTDWLTDWLANERRNVAWNLLRGRHSDRSESFLPFELSSKRRSILWKRNSFHAKKLCQRLR